MRVKFENTMKMKGYRLLVIALLALGAWSCTDFKEENTKVSEDGRYDEVLISLTSTKGQSIAIDETRVHVGNVSGTNVTHYWDEGDQVGMFTLNSTASASNHVASIDVIMENKNRATFSGMIQTSSDITDYDLFVYYPYNSSLLSDVTTATAQANLKAGLPFRLANDQYQNSYNTALDDYNHPSRAAITTNGFAYDLIDCTGTVGTFELNHANTYLQFNVVGKQTDNGDGTVGTDFANGNHRLSHVIIEAGTYGSGGFSSPVAIAGNYTFSYDYNESTFTDNPENVVISLKSGTSGNTTVKTTLQAPEGATLVPALSSTALPVFAVINTSQFTDAVNCLKVTATCNEYNESGAIVKVNTRIRYYNIATVIANGGMKGGDYYSINFEMSNPVESYTHLDAEGNSNCYIISGPGLYTFDVSMAGNGMWPGNDEDLDDEADFTLDFDPAALMSSDKTYKLDWLWASGTSFDAATGDTPIAKVESIVKNVALSGTDGIMQLELAESASSLSGNIMVALYEDTDNDDICDSDETIVWSWHLWLGTPIAQYYKFANTDNYYSSTDGGEPLNNEDWHMLDRNLGAESNELGDPRSAGLYYQSGRKDPFIGYASQTGSTSWASNRLTTYLNTATFPSHAAWTTSSNGKAFTVANVCNYPMSLFANDSKDEIFTYGWVQGTTSTLNNSKTFFDPCPPGYKLPTTREWDNFKNNEFYCANESINKTGVFGYCAYRDAAFSTNDAGTTMQERVNAGDYYDINENGERTYYIHKNSGTGQLLTTTFPNTGWLSADGTYNALVGTTGSATVNIVGAPQISTVGGSATSEMTALASPTVLATPITDGEDTEVTQTVTISSASSSSSDRAYTFTLTLSESLPSGVTMWYSTSTSGSKTQLSVSGTTATNTSTSSQRTIYVWISADGGETFSDGYATITRSQGGGGGNNNTTTTVSNGTLSITTGTAASLTGYTIEMSRLSGLSYYWTTDATLSTDNQLTQTQFTLETTDTDIYIWAVDNYSNLYSYTRLQYSGGVVTTTKQNAANVTTVNIGSYYLEISNYDAAKEYYWTTTPYFADDNEIDLSTSATISTSAEQIYIWAYNPNLGVNSNPSMLYYYNMRFGYTNGTPATDSQKTVTTNEGGNFILWSTGRINGSSFDNMWFGPGDTDELSRELGSYNPYTTVTTDEALILYAPNGVGGANNKMTYGPAAPVRCIREYNAD